MLSGSSHVLERDDKELTADEEKALQAMDLEEVRFKHTSPIYQHIS